MFRNAGLAVVILFLGTGVALGGINDGLVAFYPFNGNANDESGNGNNGVVFGASLDDDRFGNPDSAYRFNGANSHITVNEISSLDGLNQMSVSFWVNSSDGLNRSSPRQDFFHKKQDSNSCSCWDINYGDAQGNLTTVLHYEGSICGGGNIPHLAVMTHPTDLSAERWYHIVMTFDHAGPMKYYIDGLKVHEASHDWNATVNSRDSHTPLHIGSRSDGHYFFNGKLDDIRIYNRVLSESEIGQLFSSSATRYQVIDEDFLQIGNRWVYDFHLTKIDDNPADYRGNMVWEAVRREEYRGYDCVVFTMLTSVPGLYEELETFHWRFSSTAIEIIRYEDEDDIETFINNNPSELLPLWVDESAQSKPFGYGEVAESSKANPDDITYWTKRSYISFIGIEKIAVPAGTFECIKSEVTTNIQGPETEQDTITFWTHPDYGIIQMLHSSWESDDGTSEFTAELISTNLPRPKKSLPWMPLLLDE